MRAGVRAREIQRISAHIGNKSSTDLAGEAQFFSLIETHEQGIDAVRPIGSVAADNQLLLRFQFELYPVSEALARLVERILSLGDYTLNPGVPQSCGYVRGCAGTGWDRPLITAEALRRPCLAE
jgi:hypothetical protein